MYNEEEVREATLKYFTNSASSGFTLTICTGKSPCASFIMLNASSSSAPITNIL